MIMISSHKLWKFVAVIMMFMFFVASPPFVSAVTVFSNYPLTTAETGTLLNLPTRSKSVIFYVPTGNTWQLNSVTVAMGQTGNTATSTVQMEVRTSDASFN